MGGILEPPADKEATMTGDHHSGTSELEKEEYKDSADLTPWRFFLLCVGLCIGLFLSMLDSSIVATSLFTIGAEFQSLQSINWVALAYTLAFLGCAVVFARMADILGRRNAFLAAFAVFFGFSIGCGFAQSLTQLIACRALQGMGGSGLFSVAMIIFPEISPPKMRQYIAAIVGLVIAIAGVMGPVLGGVLTRYASWRWIFWINGPVGAVGLVLFFLTWPSAEHLPSIEKRSWRSLDVVGSSLLVSAAVLFVFAFQNAGVEDGAAWNQAVFIAPLIIGVVCWAALFGWSYLVDRKWSGSLAAALPFNLLRHRVYTAGILNTMFMGFPFFTTVYAFPLRTQVVNEKSALTAGLLLLPMLGSVAVGSTLAGAINSKKNYVFETLVVATCLMIIGCALETTLSSSLDLEAKALGFLVFIGLGFGLSASSSTLMTALEAPIREHAPAQGVLGQFRVLGGSIGIAASTAVLGVKERSELAGLLSAPQLSSLSSASATLTPEQSQAVRQAFADAFTQDMTVSAIVVAVGLVFTLGLYRKKRLSLDEQRQMQIEEEMAWRRASRAPVLAPTPEI